MYFLLQRHPATQSSALLREELNCGRRNQLLQRPASRELSAPLECSLPRAAKELRVNNLIRDLDIR